MVTVRTIGLLSILSIVSGCGSDGSQSTGYIQNTVTKSTSIYFENLNPITLAFNRSDSDPSLIEPVNRVINLFEYDQLVEPQITLDQTQVLSFVTGMGIEAGINTLNEHGELIVQALPIRMAIRAREWDPRAKAFKPTTKIFAQQGVPLDSAQEFAIVEAYDPNYVFTGLGMRLREGKFTKLQLQRKDLASIYQAAPGLSAVNRIELPAGWAAVGLIIAVDKISQDLPTRDPFVEDIIIYTGHLVHN